MRYITFIIMVVAIPLDFVFWNLIFWRVGGYHSLKKCASEGYRLWLKAQGGKTKEAYHDCSS